MKTRFDGITDFPLVGKIFLQMNGHWNSKSLNSKYIPKISGNSSFYLYKTVTLYNMSSDGGHKLKVVDENGNIVSR